MKSQLAILSTLLLTGVIAAVPATDSQAGNKWMMKKNANELIMLNSMLLERLGTIQQDGRIILSGEVIHEDGKTLIKLYQLQQIPSSGEENILAPEVFDKSMPYRIFLREDSLSEIPGPTEEQQE